MATPLFPLRNRHKLEFEYDYKNRRVGKKVYSYTADSWPLDSTITFVYDGWNLIRETTTTDAGNSTDYYVWGLDLSGSLQGAGGIGGLLMRDTGSGSSLYLYDANGNVGQLVDAADGAIAAHYEYGSFGKLLAASGPEAAQNPFRFSTKYFDAETGLYYYGYRYYSPELGRWIHRDPIEEQGGLNLYGFVKNDGTNAWDYLGLYTLEEAIRKEFESMNPLPPVSGGRSGPHMTWAHKLKEYFSKLSQQEIFDLWYKWEKTQGQWWINLPKCPKKLECIDDKPQNPDATKWKTLGEPMWAELALHPGAAWTMRSFEDSDGHTNQCTYDDEGILLPMPPGSGTVDWYRSGTSKHITHDVDPIVLANSLDEGEELVLASPWGPSILAHPGPNMMKYYEVRPLYAEP